jgi:hypothetical protein
VKPTVCKPKFTCTECLFDSLNRVNKHFADIATDVEYSLAESSSEDRTDIRTFNEYDIFICLSGVKRTAAGYDKVYLLGF